MHLMEHSRLMRLYWLHLLLSLELFVGLFDLGYYHLFPPQIANPICAPGEGAEMFILLSAVTVIRFDRLVNSTLI